MFDKDEVVDDSLGHAVVVLSEQDFGGDGACPHLREFYFGCVSRFVFAYLPVYPFEVMYAIQALSLEH